MSDFLKTMASLSAERAALAISAAAGTIHVFAAGNEFGTSAQDTNKTQTQNSPDCITVAALGSDGMAAYYSNFGACIFVTAPSSSSSVLFRVTTTGRSGSAGYYTGSGGWNRRAVCWRVCRDWPAIALALA